MTEEKKSEVIAEVKYSNLFHWTPIFLKDSENLDIWVICISIVSFNKKYFLSFCYVFNISQSSGNTEKNTQLLPPMSWTQWE